MAAFRGDAELPDTPIGNRRFLSDADRNPVLDGVEEIGMGVADDAEESL